MTYEIVRTPFKRYMLLESRSARVIDSGTKKKPLQNLGKDIERRIAERRLK